MSALDDIFIDLYGEIMLMPNSEKAKERIKSLFLDIVDGVEMGFETDYALRRKIGEL